MNFEKVNRLCEIYHLLNEENNITREQRNLYNIQKFICDLEFVVENNNLKSLINTALISGFEDVSATQYVELLNKTADELKSKTDMNITIDFLNQFDQLLSKDNLYEKYVFGYIKSNNLEKDLEYYDTYQSCFRKKEETKKKYRQKKRNWIILLIALITSFIIPVSIAMIDLGEDGNTFNLLNTIVNFTTMIISLGVFVLVHNLLLKKKISRTSIKVILDIVSLFVIFFLGIFVSPYGITGFFMICPTFIILMNMKDSINNTMDKIKNDCDFSNFYNSKIVLKKKPKAKENEEIIEPFAYSKKASLVPSIIGVIASILLMILSVGYIIMDYYDIAMVITEMLFIVFLGYCVFMNVRIILARIKINKLDMPEYRIEYNTYTETMTIDLIDEKKTISLKDINYIENVRLNNHTYTIKGITVHQDIINPILIHLKNGDVLVLYFIKDTIAVTEKLSNLIATV